MTGRRWCRDNQSGDNRGDLLIHQSLRTVPARFFEFCTVGCQPYARTDHNQQPGRKPALLQRSIAWRISPRSIIGKAPRSLICCTPASWLGEKSSGRCFAGIPPTGKKLRPAPVDLSFGLAWQTVRVIGVISKNIYNDVITMISSFWRPLSAPTTPAYRGTPYVDYWFLPSSTRFFSSEPW